MFACFLGVMPTGSADPIAPDPVPRAAPSTAPVLRPSWDLDGTYLWLGPSGGAGYLDAQWDSTFGGDASVVRVREHETFGAIGATLGASKWTQRGGGRAWLDLLVGTRLGGHMVGASAGSILEFGELMRPHAGATIGVWGFAGVTPYAKVGAVVGLGTFAEIGIHIALPVLRR